MHFWWLHGRMLCQMKQLSCKLDCQAKGLYVLAVGAGVVVHVLGLVELLGRGARHVGGRAALRRARSQRRLRKDGAAGRKW